MERYQIKFGDRVCTPLLREMAGHALALLYLVLRSNCGSHFSPRAVSDRWPNSARPAVFSIGDHLLLKPNYQSCCLKFPDKPATLASRVEAASSRLHDGNGRVVPGRRRLATGDDQFNCYPFQASSGYCTTKIVKLHMWLIYYKLTCLISTL